VSQTTPSCRVAIVGNGRLGTALAEGFRAVGDRVAGPLARDYRPADLLGSAIVLLCVPDREISAAAGILAQRLGDGAKCVLVGHCSGASTLDVLQPFDPDKRFSLHPLMSVTDSQRCIWDGVFAAISGISERALSIASQLAVDLGMSPFAVDDRDRGAYHAAASVASNFLVTLELAAERLAASAGVNREALAPLVRGTVENWAREGDRALTGPIARGDTATVLRQREAIAQRTPELLALFDVLGQATQELAITPVAA
jgi:predicted short-subunit dehydrogenase-like oxidoreductase (DUF2520 family)